MEVYLCMKQYLGWLLVYFVGKGLRFFTNYICFALLDTEQEGLHNKGICPLVVEIEDKKPNTLPGQEMDNSDEVTECNFLS
jgi:hypothetical protein